MFRAMGSWRVVAAALLCLRCPTMHAAEDATYSVLSSLYHFSGNYKGSSPWYSRKNWLDGDPCTNSWYGLTCSSNNIVDSLQLQSNNLGEIRIPSQFGLLTELTAIAMLDDALTGEIPTEIGALTKLVTIDFTENTLTGSVPTEIGKLTALSGPPSSGIWWDSTHGGLRFGTNQLTGSVPTEIGQLTVLDNVLEFSSNGLVGIKHPNDHTGNKKITGLPSELGNLVVTSGVLFYYNALKGSLPTELGKLTGLTQRMALDHNSFSGAIPSELGRLTRYSSSSYTATLSGFLNDNSFTGWIPSEFGAFTEITAGFNLETNCLSGSIPTQLGDMSKLTYDFSINDNGLEGTIPTELGRMSNMVEEFYVNSNALSQELPSELGSFTNLIDDFQFDNNPDLCGDIPSELGALTDNTNNHVVLDTGGTDVTKKCGAADPNYHHGPKRCQSDDDDIDNFDPDDSPYFWIVLGVGIPVFIACSLLIGSKSGQKYQQRREAQRRMKHAMPAATTTWKPDGIRNSDHESQDMVNRLSEIVKYNDALRSFMLDYKMLEIERRPIAAGGSGQVYRGTYGGDVVAIKTVFSQMVQTSDFEEITHEAALLAQIHNPRFVRLYGIALNGPTIHVVTEFVDHTLMDWFERDEDSQEQIKSFCRVAGQLLDGIAFIHKRSISHRDIKPQNVLMTADTWDVKICDLGMSRAQSAGKQQTMTVGVGTPLYMPPEAILDEEEIQEAYEARMAGASEEEAKKKRRYDASAWDIYSLGILFHAMWYKKEPFEGWAATKVVIEVATKGSRPKFDVDPIPPASFIDLVASMWHQQHQDRPKIDEVQRKWRLIRAELLGEHVVEVTQDGAGAGAGASEDAVMNPLSGIASEGSDTRLSAPAAP